MPDASPNGAPAAPLPGTPEYDAAMSAKFLAGQGGQPEAAKEPAATPPAVKPEGIPDKFWDAAKGEVRVAEMAKSYAELEKLRSQPPVTKEPAKPADSGDAAADAAKGDEAAARAVVPEFDKYAAEFAEKGELSSETYATLEKAGIPKALVDQYIEGQKARADLETAEVFAEVGGADAYSKMVAWAAKSMSQAEIDAFNASAAASPQQRMLAVQGLKARFAAAEGADPKLLGGAGGDGAGDQPFESAAEVTRAMRDQKYKTDPAYRAQVQRRLAANPSVVSARVY